ncbi:chromosome segregation protein SMC [Actinomyces minihominis]|uniref:chromosome segregation protein SMC n=1 Tax=Actinomyces minihominis TaxID=2002838 RepID=UPI000C06E581|nr:chromosome segregation protein SMC [Actinomyces minihominis]
MYLKELTAAGFKSFASTTRFQFEPGITAIVGPNGSGKSNVVDALAWVMGEQGAKSLRGGNMADVIFAGGTTRGPLGRAHVELTIDNSDGRLPISYSEVTISRTMFRSGGSEYAINRQPVRLLDVQELLSDSGLGRQMHVIVGQGQLDTVLSASPTDRRSFIDEAAGVAKHRRRKERALRKLESMDANLVRVLDLTEEMRSRLRPLARQAKAAREAAGVRYALGYATARILGEDLVKGRADLARDSEVLERLRGAARVSAEELDELKRRQVLVSQLQARARERADMVGERYRDFTEQRERLIGIEEIAQERASSAARTPTAISESSVQLAVKRAEEAEAEAAEQRSLSAQAEAAHREATVIREQREPLVRDAEQALRRAQGDVRSRQERYARLVREAENAALSSQAARGQFDSAQQRLVAAEQRHAAATKDARTFASQGLTAHDGQTTIEGNSEASAFENASIAEQGSRDMLAAAEREERDLGVEVSRLRSRRETLEASLSGGAGVQRSASEQIRAFGDRLLSSPRLEDTLQIERGWEEALTAVLGPLLSAHVVEGQELYGELLDEIPAGISAPDLDSAGLVTQVGTSPINLSSTPEGWIEIGAELGVVPAYSVVAAEGPGNTLGPLLVDTWVAPSIGAAQEFHRLLGPWSATEQADRVERIIVATSSGTVVGSNFLRLRGQQVTSRLSLRADLEETRVAEDSARERLQASAAKVRVAREAMQAAIKSKNAALTELRAADAERAKVAQEQARLNALAHAAEVDVERVRRQVGEAEARMEAAKAAEAKAAALVPEQAPSEDEVDLEAVARAIDEAREALQQAWEVENQARLDAHIARERSAASDRQSRAFATQAQTLREDRERQVAREMAAKGAVAGFQVIMSRARAGAARAEEAAGTALSLRTAARDRHHELTEELGGIAEQIRQLERDQVAANETLLQTEVAVAGQRSLVNQLEEKARVLTEDYGQILKLRVPMLLEKYGSAHAGTEATADAEDGEGNLLSSEPTSSSSLAADEVISHYGPHLPWNPQPPSEASDVDEGETAPFTREHAEAERSRAERSLARLGIVNPLAIEEYEAASARYTFLENQVEDLNRSKSDLLALVREIDTQVRESFASAFADTAKMFERTFSKLFPGGTGRLELTEPDDPLTTGVEIYARPSGKRVTRLSLLSGGERSLAALAYLIAIFEARPSPFYVLDEIEAALDDINLSRVLSLLEDLRKESQLLIITHQKRTMEFADALYGVTMKDGVTAVMSHRMAS